MSDFCKKCGHDEYVCQVCGRIFCSREKPSTWMKPVPHKKYNGNVCPECVKFLREIWWGSPDHEDYQ